MSIILGLLFIALPVAAALSLDITAFAAVLILFCVIAGLSESGFDRVPSSARKVDHAGDQLTF